MCLNTLKFRFKNWSQRWLQQQYTHTRTQTVLRRIIPSRWLSIKWFAYESHIDIIQSGASGVPLAILWTWNGAKLSQLKELNANGVHLMNFLAMEQLNVYSICAHSLIHERCGWRNRWFILANAMRYGCFFVVCVFILNARLLLLLVAWWWRRRSIGGIDDTQHQDAWCANFMVKRYSWVSNGWKQP